MQPSLARLAARSSAVLPTGASSSAAAQAHLPTSFLLAAALRSSSLSPRAQEKQACREQQRGHGASEAGAEAQEGWLASTRQFVSEWTSSPSSSSDPSSSSSSSSSSFLADIFGNLRGPFPSSRPAFALELPGCGGAADSPQEGSSSPSSTSPASLLRELVEPILRAVPKKKVSHSRKSMRSANKGLKDRVDIVHCPGCGRPKLGHHLCQHCYGDINRRQKAELREHYEQHAQTQAIQQEQIQRQLERAAVAGPGAAETAPERA
ncbi:hypothetical protein OC842_004088 [Tilletia horrida]|uniref:Large ribosomal subunit protein bL32m n=1 Tax=Tilletia horrida TaxID=155126 RepID=A0AAN6GAK3_9BASI|nr:hypothetical protein OC842_004088 [Tilletia horrida]